MYVLITIDSYSQTGANDFGNEKIPAPDYIHFNSMDLDADGNLICSFRHIHSISCLDRGASENQIKWTLSGVADEFGLSPIQKCSVQYLYDEVYVIGWGIPMGDPEALSVVEFAAGETLMSISLKNPHEFHLSLPVF